MNRQLPLVILILIFAGFGIYWNSLGNTFQYDDQLYVTENQNIRTLKNLPRFFTNPGLITSDPHQAGHYRPLVVASYAVNYAVSGLNPVAYHLTNLMFHIGAAFLVFLIVKAMLASGSNGIRDTSLSEGSFFVPFAAGILFLVHPFNSEAVNYITARSSLMSSFFYLLGFYCWVQYRGRVEIFPPLVKGGEGGIESGFSGEQKRTYLYYTGTLLAFVFGMLSKEVVVTLPGVLWLYDIYFYRPSYSLSASRTPHSALRTLLNWRNYLLYLPFVLMVVIPYMVIRAASFGGVVPSFKRDIWTQLLTVIPVLTKHWQMFFFPYPLTPVHYVDIQRSFWSYTVISALLIMVSYTVIAVLIAKGSSPRWRIVSFFMFWFYIVLLPITIFPLNAIFQENRGYLAAVSFAVLSGVALGELGKVKLQKVGVVVLILLTALCSFVVFNRNRVWKDEISLWSDTVKKVPRSPAVYSALGVAYRRAGMYNQAIDSSKKALRLGGDNNFIAHYNLGHIYMDYKRWELAAGELEKAVRDYPDYSPAYIDLGTVYYRLGKFDLAEKQYMAAIRLTPYDYRPYFNVGVIYSSKGRAKEAINAYRKTLSIYPGHLRARLNLGIEIEELGKGRNALTYYKYVLEHAGGGEEALVREASRRIEEINRR